MRARWFIGLALGLWLAALGRDRFDVWIDATVLPPLAVEMSVEVLDRDGDLLRAYTVADGRWRLALPPDKVDPLYLRILLAYEDKRFRDHPGVDLRSMTRAVLQAVWNGRVVSGGSTLTMQVARLLEEGTTGEVAGKLRQMRVALALERRLTKDQILQLYLHLAPFGGNLEGVRAASISYFGKEPWRLTPAEAALLVTGPRQRGTGSSRGRSGKVSLTQKRRKPRYGKRCLASGNPSRPLPPIWPTARGRISRRWGPTT